MICNLLCFNEIKTNKNNKKSEQICEIETDKKLAKFVKNILLFE